MSYENETCPCGWKKQSETMLCPLCAESLKDDANMQVFNDPAYSVEHRRQAAIALITLARRLKHKPA